MSDLPKNDSTRDLKELVRHYDQIRRLAESIRAKESRPPTLQTTELAHEAMVRATRSLPESPTADENLILSHVALNIRHILVDRARARNAQKRNSGKRPQSLGKDHDVAANGDTNNEEAIDFASALSQLPSVLGQLTEQQRELILLRYGIGLSASKIAQLLTANGKSCSDDTVGRWLDVAEARLRSLMKIRDDRDPQ